MILLTLLMGLMVPAACGPDVDTNSPTLGEHHMPIINGKRCTEEIDSSAVALILEGKMTLRGFDVPMRSVMCTGTLIAPDVVLTAAHCATPSMVTGGMGTISDVVYHVVFTADLATYANPMRGLPPQVGGIPLAALPKEALRVREYFPHPDFTPKDLETFKGGTQENLHDLALMFLETPVPLDAVRPAVVITQTEAQEHLVTKASVRIAGWGQQVVTPNPLVPPPAGSVGVKICATSFINELGPHEMQIGGGPESSRKCHGDSGGPTYLDIETPFTIKERVVGITSHAYDDTDCAKGGVDTRIDAWLSWIDDQMKKRCADSTRAWCDVAGIIPPDFYEPPPPPDTGATTNDGGLTNDGGSSDGATDQGCTCDVSASSPGHALPWFIALLILALRRKNRQSRAH